MTVQVHSTKPSLFKPAGEASACYLEVGGRLLLVQRTETCSEALTWGVPGGKVDKGETALEAAARELLEETGIKAALTDLVPLGPLFIQKKEIAYTFHMFYLPLQEMPEVLLSGEHIDYKWALPHEIEALPLMSGGRAAYRHFCSVRPGVKKRPATSVSVYLILRNEGKILLGLRKNTGYCDGLWSLPAGHVEEGEAATGAMVRESLEELDIRVEASDLVPVHIMHRQSNRQNIDIFFSCEKWKGNIKNCEEEKCEKLEFFALSALPKDLVPYQRAAIESAGTFFSESGWDA